MDVILVPLINLLIIVMNMLTFAIFIMVVLSWLTMFGIINPYNRFVMLVQEFLNKLLEPMLQPIRRILPNMGGLDLSPIILLLSFYFLSDVLARLAYKL